VSTNTTALKPRSSRTGVGDRGRVAAAAVERQHERPRRQRDRLTAQVADERRERDRVVAGAREHVHVALELLAFDLP
jgi:hypothetical protein